MAIHFSKTEFQDREKSVIYSLRKKNLDALLIFRQESMYWLTGFDTFGYVFFQCLVLTAKGEKILLTRTPDLRQAQNTSIIKDIRIWIDKDGASPSNELKNILYELNLDKKKIGVEYVGNPIREEIVERLFERFCIVLDVFSSKISKNHRISWI